MTSFFPEPGSQPGAERPSTEPFTPAAGGGFRTAGPAPQVPAPPPSRWAKSDVSFGPVGRTVGTVLLIAVGVWLLVFSLIGAGVWWLVVTPWALRDLWRPVSRSRR